VAAVVVLMVQMVLLKQTKMQFKFSNSMTNFWTDGDAKSVALLADSVYIARGFV